MKFIDQVQAVLDRAAERESRVSEAQRRLSEADAILNRPLKDIAKQALAAGRKS